MNRALLLEGVGRRYGLGGAPWVLRGVDLTLAPGTLTRIEGANGTGKSTLLRLLAGIDAPTEGRITGRPRTAYVPERFPAALPFTAAGYLIHLGSVHGLSRGEAAGAAVEWLERLGAAEYARTPMPELSKGSSQKVAVAQALLAEPELLVLDEAWTGLDTAARTELERAVLERRAAGGTVVFVDHDPRRLAGAPDFTYAVVDGNVRTVTGSSVPAEESYVVVEVEGPPGAEPPAEATRLAVSIEEPGPVPAPVPAPVPGRLRLAVPATHSDTLLRTLLTARPPWHVVSVGEGTSVAGVLPRAPAAAAVDADADAGADVDAEVRS
ncbi:ABC-type multidrug transport system ATPase subunit [Streptomyces umbrinus]|uniref:ABC-type multidrug transport system ATPase subunit n=1 Tax=Streptomyces umbrinus TaxID=67370 RepID=A0ABU0SRU4_9ACTN|nr:ATP-binding cassette domain-containing protein [Streptomyces umbrinus]MDQ1025421.1 ABC-type multidrug transport system ATPase subunit [Streptomyces umbrinus]